MLVAAVFISKDYLGVFVCLISKPLFLAVFSSLPTFPGGSVAKNPPAMQVVQDTRVQSLSAEDPLEKEMATRSSIPAWKTAWTEEPGGLQSTDHKELDMTEHTHISINFVF